MFCPGWQKWHGMFCPGHKTGMGCFVWGDKNCMGCFVRGGKSMRDVLSGVAKNGMGCFVPGCFVLHSLFGMKILWIFFGGSSQNWAIFRGHFYAL